MTFKPIKSERISHQVINQIKEQVLEGTLVPGNRLLNEREFASLLNVSRTSLREAISALEVIGLLDVRPGEGTFIRETAADDLIQSISLMLLLEKDSVRETWDVRKMLEVEGARLAAQTFEQEDAAKLKIPLEEMERAIAENRKAEEYDISFHKAVAEVSKNRLLMQLMGTISDSIRQTFTTTWPLRFSAEGAKKIHKEHLAIVTAICNNDQAGAVEAMQYHLNQVEQFLFLKSS